MATRKKRWRDKLGGNHSTAIDAAWRFLPEIIKEKTITTISPGFISAGKNPTGRNAVKIIDDVNCILLSIRGASAHQEIRIFASNPQKAKLVIARASRNAGFHISFGSRT